MDNTLQLIIVTAAVVLALVFCFFHLRRSFRKGKCPSCCGSCRKQWTPWSIRPEICPAFL